MVVLVKDQYFGDSRDYFKYHLLESLVRQPPRIDRLVCLWMLTPPDLSGDGNVPLVESRELPELARFLLGHVQVDDRKVKHLREYFRERGIEYLPWGDERPYFTRERRETYFRNVPADKLDNAVVFFDPDVGLTSSAPTPKHLAFEELKGVRARMGPDTIAVVYQHAQRKKDFWATMAAELRRSLQTSVGYVAESAVAFYIIPGAGMSPASIEEVLGTVAAAGRGRRVGPIQR
ncbi:MAG: hypothetical protein NVS3B24_10970 [Candidatus Dormibacteria bacterium]